MGYYTDIHLEAYDGSEMLNDEQWKKLIESITHPSLKEMKDFLIKIYDEDGDRCRWHYNNDLMVKLSLYFPKLTLILHGDGEERWDSWIERWRNGERLTYQAEGYMGDSLIKWMKFHHPELYCQFEEEFKEKVRQPRDSLDFKIGP